VTATDHESAVLDALDFDPDTDAGWPASSGKGSANLADLDDVPAAALEALERVAAMSAADGMTDNDLLRERWNMIRASTVEIGNGPFRTLATMLFGARIDHITELFVYDRGNETLAAEAGITVRNVQKNLTALREAKLIVPVRYGGMRGDEKIVGSWAFTTPEEHDGGDLYDLARLWFEDRGSTAAIHRRRDFALMFAAAYGDDLVVPDYLPADVQSVGDAVEFVDRLRRSYSR